MQNLQVAVVGNLGDAAFCIDVEPAAEQFGHVRLEVAQVDVWVGRVLRFRLRHRGCGSARLSHALLCLTNAESLNNELLREATLQLSSLREAKVKANFDLEEAAAELVENRATSPAVADGLA